MPIVGVAVIISGMIWLCVYVLCVCCVYSLAYKSFDNCLWTKFTQMLQKYL